MRINELERSHDLGVIIKCASPDLHEIKQVVVQDLEVKCRGHRRCIHSRPNKSHKGHMTVGVSHTICHTCSILSSETLQMTHGWEEFQEKSDILAVWPP